MEEVTPSANTWKYIKPHGVHYDKNAKLKKILKDGFAFRRKKKWKMVQRDYKLFVQIDQMKIAV